MSKNKKKIISILLLAFAVAIIPVAVFASDDEDAAGEIKFYDPKDKGCSGGGNSWSENCGEVSGSNRTELLHSYIDNYAGVAINLQIEYGIPWEAFFFHICGESNCGDVTLEGSMAKWVYDDLGGYNLAGMHGKGGPYATGTYVTNRKNHDFANHATIQDNIAAFVVSIMRNGYYDAALKYGDYRTFDLRKFLETEIGVYICGDPNCPRSANYGGWIMLDEIENYAKQQGIPSSKEIAEQYQITEGGKHPDHGNMQTQLGWENFSQHYECSGANTTNTAGSTTETSEPTESTEDPGDPGDPAAAKTPQSNTGNGTDSSSAQTLSENGLTYEQAEKLVEFYQDPANNSEYDLSGTYGVHCNCTSMSNYFTQVYTTLTYGGGNGQAVARQTANANPSATELITNGPPKIPSIFSVGVGGTAAGHTGVVVGYDASTDEYITIEAGWAEDANGNGIDEQKGKNEGACEAASGWYASKGAAIRKKLDYWTSKSYNFAYIKPEAINTDKLMAVAGGSFGGSSCKGSSNNTAFTGDFKFLSQCDPKWKSDSYSGGTICSSGCGLTSFTMIANYLDGTDLTPTQMRDKVNQNWPGNMEATAAAAQIMGYKSVDISRTENVKYNATVQQIVDAINKYLDQGYIIELSGHINSSSKGAQYVCKSTCKWYNDLFSSNGHYVVFYGKDASGNWLLADPGNSSNNGKALDPTDAVERGIKRADGSTNIYGVKK